MHPLSPLLKDRISSAIVAALKSGDPINVIQIAERVQNENASENVALEDIQNVVLDRALATGKPIIFETMDDDRLKPAFDTAGGGAEARGTFQ